MAVAGKALGADRRRIDIETPVQQVRQHGVEHQPVVDRRQQPP